MGEVGFAKSFNMLRDAKSHHAVDILRRFMGLLGLLSPMPWVGRLGRAIPGAVRDWKRFVSWCLECTKERMTVSFSSSGWKAETVNLS